MFVLLLQSVKVFLPAAEEKPREEEGFRIS
jgi:hypothetical protein